MRRLGRSLVVVLAVVALVVVSPAAASASERVSVAGPVAAAEPLPYIPSNSKWRQWMVNVVSSVLGASTPNKWKAEQIANVYKYDGGFETLNQKFGIDAIRMNEAGQITGVKYTNKGTGTYTDVVIAGLEESYNQKSAQGRGPVRAPATPVKTFFKTVGGVASALFAYELGSTLGAAGINAVSSPFLGFDASGVVCGAQGFDNDFQRWVFRTMSGQNCDQWDYDAEYLVNLDAALELTDLTRNGVSIAYVTTFPGYYYNTTCYSITGGSQFAMLGPGQGFFYMAHNGVPSKFFFSSGGAGYCGGVSNTTGPGTYSPTWTNVGLPDTPAFWIAQESTPTVKIAELGSSREDPDRQQKCTVTYTDNSTLSVLSDVYKESAGAPGAECPNTPAGKTPDRVQVEETFPGSPGAAPVETYDEQVTPEYQDWWEEYPECRGGACALDLIRKLPTPAVSCFDLDDGCPDWADDPEKVDKYQCRYGVHNVDLEECNVYAGIFQPGRVATGSPYADPTTGTWSGGQNAPRSADGAMTRTIQNPDTLRSCNFPNAFLDPVGAAIAGGQCLLEWAFVPRPIVVETAMVGSAESWEGKPPAVVAGMVDTFAMAPAASGCSLTVSLFGHSVTPVDVCGGSPLALLPVLSRLITSGFLAIVVFTLVRRQVAGMVGYNQGQG